MDKQACNPRHTIKIITSGRQLGLNFIIPTSYAFGSELVIIGNSDRKQHPGPIRNIFMMAEIAFFISIKLRDNQKK